MYNLLYKLLFVTLMSFSSVQLFAQHIIKNKDGGRVELDESGNAKQYDSKGNLTAEGKLKNFQKTGEWKYYEGNGSLYAIEQYNMHKLEGPAIYYFSGTSLLQATGKYKEGKRDDEWKFYARKNNHLYATVHYRHGIIHGPATYYDTVFNGHKIGEGIHHDGKRKGKWQFYSDVTGKMHGIEHYENGLMEGPATYFDTINICEEPVCTTIADGQYEKNLRVGVWTFYYTPSGKIYSTETYKDSIVDGMAKYYSESTGKLVSEGTYSKGLAHGKWSYYDSVTGKKLYELAFVNDVDTATIEFFDDSRGFVKSIERYKGDVLFGDKELYDSLSGNIETKFHYENDVITGLSSYEEGKLVSYNGYKYNGDSSYLSLYNPECSHKTSEGFYKDTSHTEGYIVFYFQCSDRVRSIVSLKGQHKQVKYFDSTMGVVFAEGAFVNEERSGEWRYYYRDSRRLHSVVTYNNDMVDGMGRYFDSLTGKVIIEGNFKQGYRDGKWTTYNINTGKPLTEENFKNGELQGKQIIFDTTGNIFCSYSYKNGKRSGDGYVNYYGTNTRSIELNYKEDSLHGMLTTYYRDSKLKREEKYEHGRLVSSKCYLPGGDTTAYYPVMIQPRFEEDVMSYIGRNLKYPQEARENRAEGKVIVRFKILETGMVKDAEIIKSAGHGMDEEAIRLISQMPPWEPAYFDGIPYTTYKTLPIVFWLQDDNK